MDKLSKGTVFQFEAPNGVPVMGELIDSKMGDTLVSYAILPDYDIALRDFTAEGEV